MITLALPIVVLLVGLLLYFAGTGKWNQLGLEMFWVGLLVSLLAFSHSVTLR